MRKFSGFTLMELIVVVVIIGILSIIAIPNYIRAVERSRCSQAISILKTIRTAGLSYFADNETFAGVSLDTLETQVGANFYSDGSNPDWTFSVTSSTASGLGLSATRTGGPRDTQTITLNDDIPGVNEVWGGTYDRLDPGGF